MFARIFVTLTKILGRMQQPEMSKVLDEYVAVLPSKQNSIDLVPGWNNALPPQFGVIAGANVFYNDDRIRWGLEQFGSLEGKYVLELGPLEASHTYMLHQAGAGRILAIEANKLAFMRCLIVKEIMRLTNAEFLLGDCQRWLRATNERYDLIVACGVLYHMTEPVQLIESLCAHTDAVIIWTHYFDEAELQLGDPRRSPFSGLVVTKRAHGIDIRLHERSYHEAWRDKKFCGGLNDTHYWMEKVQIFDLLRANGFSDLRVAMEQPDHPNGPSFCVFAKRTRSVD